MIILPEKSQQIRGEVIEHIVEYESYVDFIPLHFSFKRFTP